MAKTFIDAAEVAQELCLSPGSFLQKRESLVEHQGFPQAMPHCQRPLLWRASEVKAWINRQGLPRDTPIEPTGNVIRLQRMAATA